MKSWLPPSGRRASNTAQRPHHERWLHHLSVSLTPCSGMKRPHEESAAADPDAAVAAPGDAHVVKERLLQMESDFRAGRQQQAAEAAEAAAAKERGAGDWANYQPPSAVLQAVQQRQAAAPPAAAPPAAAAAPQAAAAPAAAQGGQRELPPALRARLAARGILPKDEGANGSAAASEDAGPLPPGWHQATDPTYNHVYYYCPATGERSWTRPKPAVRATAAGMLLLLQRLALSACRCISCEHVVCKVQGPGSTVVLCCCCSLPRAPPCPWHAAACWLDGGQGPDQWSNVLFQRSSG